MRVSLRENGPNIWASEILTVPIVALCGIGLVSAILLAVILPAVWSRRAARRRAALHVLDRLVRLLRPRA
ncbi:hypothetical protein [Acrocarpospora phusangensis]|uniref:hypothetical protein n=1 Tax=Acrocarpospora phusangensis TaxID=1070424 RepID=UPI00194EB901|nr:hypothetical protein [Acrocarpospora phusangensis]